MHTIKFQFRCLMSSSVCLLYYVIQDFVQKALFFRYRQLEVGGITTYDKGTRDRDTSTVLNH